MRLFNSHPESTRILFLILGTLAHSVKSYSSSSFPTSKASTSLPRIAGRGDSRLFVQSTQTFLGEWPGKTGEAALRKVQFLASKVAESTSAAEESKRNHKNSWARGTGGNVFDNPQVNGENIEKDDVNAGVAKDMVIKTNTKRDKDMVIKPTSKREEQVWIALANLEIDSKIFVSDFCDWLALLSHTGFCFRVQVQLLDKMAGQNPQLTALELTILSGSVAAAASGPFLFGGALTGFLAPTAAACKSSTMSCNFFHFAKFD
jgi:hypothetical protein